MNEKTKNQIAKDFVSFVVKILRSKKHTPVAPDLPYTMEFVDVQEFFTPSDRGPSCFHFEEGRLWVNVRKALWYGNPFRLSPEQIEASLTGHPAFLESGIHVFHDTTEDSKNPFPAVCLDVTKMGIQSWF